MAADPRVDPFRKTRHSGYLPAWTWLRGYDRRWLRGDILAGLTITALVVPEGIAYAEIAGMPPQSALYAAWIALVAYAVLGSSRQLVVGPSSAIALMSATTVAALGFTALSEEWVLATMALAVLTGAVLLLAGLLRLGRIAQFFSESVLAGFITGLALIIIVRQIPKLLGVEGGEGNFWQRCVELLRQVQDLHPLTLAVGLASLAIMILVERRSERLPAALVALLFGIFVGAVFALETRGVHVVGEIPAGLSTPMLPKLALEEWLLLLPGAIGLGLVVFAEAIAPARSLAGQHGYEVEADQEMIALGAANLGAGLFRGFSVGGSLSKSAANDDAGARSQVSGLVAAVLTILIALFFTDIFYHLPEATLAAIIIVAVWSMVKIDAFRQLWKVRREDFALATIAMLGVLTFEETLHGLVLAVAISLLALIVRASRARISVLGREPGTLRLSSLKHHPQNLTLPGLFIVRPDEGIYFAIASTIREEIRAAARAQDPPAKTVLLDLEMSNELDAPSAEEIGRLHEDLAASDIRLELCRVHSPVRAILDRAGVSERIGDDYIHERDLDAALEYLERHGGDEDLAYAVADGIAQLLRHLTLLAESFGRDEDTIKRLRASLERLEARLEREGGAPSLRNDEPAPDEPAPTAD